MKGKTFNIHDASSTQTADILGITRQRVSQLRSQGIIKNNGKRGRYDVPQAIKDYAAYITDNGGGDAQTRLIVQRTRKLKIENDKAEARLIDMGDAAEVLNAALSVYLTSTDEIPDTLARRLARSSSPAEIRRVIDKEFDATRDRIVSKLITMFGLPPTATIDDVKAKLDRGARK